MISCRRLIAQETQPCRACHKAIEAGDYFTLIPLGPGDNEEERARMAAGLVYTAVCASVHWGCCDDNYKRRIDRLETRDAQEQEAWESGEEIT